MIFKEEIIQLITKIRKEKKVSQERLGRGICSGQQISRLEKEEILPDFFLLEMLMQRLGRSTDKLEIVISEDEFQAVQECDEILDALRKGKLSETEARLERFCRGMERGGTVKRLQGFRLKGIYALEKGEYGAAEMTFRQAAGLFLDGRGIEDLSAALKEGRLMSDVELEILLLLAQVDGKLGKKEEAGELLCFLYSYVQEKIADEERVVKFLPRIAVLASDLAGDAGREREYVALCERALELLRKHGMLQMMTPLLAFLGTCYTEDGRAEEARKLFLWRETIEQLYEEFDLSVDMVNKLYFSSRIGQFYLTGEIIREERLAQGLVQEDLIGTIYQNPESLSRIENGRKPERKMQAQIFEKLGLKKRYYSGRVITSDYSLLELHSEIAILFSRKETEKAMCWMEVLKKKLDMSIPENRQMVECFEILYKCDKGLISREEALERTRELLRLTYKTGSRRVPFEGETLLMNQACNMLWWLKRREEAVEQQKKIINIFERSRLPLRYHYRSVYLIMDNMTKNLGYIGCQEESCEWSKRSAGEQLLNGKGNGIHKLLGNFIGREMDVGGDRQLCEKWTKWSYYLTDIFMLYHDQKYLVEYEKKHFNENVKWY